jgi:SagB-type dehydrogenase family enzyme
VSPETAAVTRRFHETTNQYVDREFGSSGAPEGFVPMDPENRPTPFNRYPDAPRIRLPKDVGESARAGVDVLGEGPSGDDAALDAALLGRLLFYGAGVSRVRTAGERQMVFRAAPAAGNLHPVELYVATGGVSGIDDGLHHFEPGEFALEVLRQGDRRRAVAAALADDRSGEAAATLILTGVPWRTGWKYTARGLRHVYWDAGSLLAQVLAVADAAGLRSEVRLGFADAALNAELGIDGVSEFAVAAVVLGQAGSAADSRSDEGPAGAAREALSKAPVEFPLVTETQTAGNLPDADAVNGWRRSAESLGRPTSERIDAPPPQRRGGTIEELIRRRGSTRLFRQEATPAEMARWCLGVAARPVPGDFCAAGATLLSHHISVHAVDGVEPGKYEWAGGDLRGARPAAGEKDARAESQHLCLNQPLGGDSAFTAYHCADLESLYEALGDRGYRAAQLEAGLAAGRLQLAAFAVGLGGTGLTFFDDAVPVAFGTGDHCMLVTAVGPADYRNTPGGLPGAPVELAGMEGLMERFSRRFQE